MNCDSDEATPSSSPAAKRAKFSVPCAPTTTLRDANAAGKDAADSVAARYFNAVWGKRSSRCVWVCFLFFFCFFFFFFLFFNRLLKIF